MIDDGLTLAWIDALESGDYQQGRGALKDGATYCALGVLADVASKRQVGGVGHWIIKTVTVPCYDEHEEFTIRHYTIDAWRDHLGGEYTGQVGVVLEERAGIAAIWPRAREILITEYPVEHAAATDKMCGNLDRIEHFNDGGFSFAQIARALRMAWAEDQEQKLALARMRNATYGYQPGEPLVLA
jgi:hypothetical protein